jgi:hypothetical protein
MKTKTILLFTLVILTLTATIKAQNIPSYIPINGLVGWWPFNGNANDESGNGNNGVLQNGVLFSSDRNSNATSACDFDGVNDQIFVNHSASISPTQNVTVSAWIFPRAYEDGKFIAVSVQSVLTGLILISVI